MLQPISSLLSASDLYALSQGYQNAGMFECHWCGAACSNLWMHDDRPILPFEKLSTTARRPGNLYLCMGCWLWRRGRITVNFLQGGQRDGQCPQNHGWWITRAEAWAVSILTPAAEVLKRLLEPPLQFALCLPSEVGSKVQLHLVPSNDHAQIQADTPLGFACNNIAYTYTVYELKEALAHGWDGKSPGVRVLCTTLHVPEPPPKVEEKQKWGRPESLPGGQTTKKVITKASVTASS